MSPAQIMLLDILTDRVITMITTIKRVETMTEQEINAEIAKWDERREDAIDELETH